MISRRTFLRSSGLALAGATLLADEVPPRPFTTEAPLNPRNKRSKKAAS